MSRNRKTNEEFLKQVFELTGDEYEFLEKYVTALTKIKVKHRKCGKSYSIKPSEFLNGSRCTYCSGLRKKTNEEFLKEVEVLVGNEYTFLEPYKNAKTKIKVRHNVCGTIYEVTPYYFLSGGRCQYCYGNKLKTNDEFTTEIKNLVGNEYKFLEPYKNSQTKIKVEHKKCGYVYKVRPSRFLSGDRCPRCSGNIRKTNKQFIAEANKLYPLKEYTFLEDYKNNRKKIKVRHNKCGHEYKVKPVEFLSGVRCPKCFGTPKKSNKRFLQDVEALVGDEYTFLENYKTNKTKLKVRHNKCGRVYEVRPDSFMNGRRCPYCKSSKGEKLISEYLTKKRIDFISEKTFRGLKDNVSLRFDFYLPSFNLAIEYDGRQHFEPVTFGGINKEKAEENHRLVKKHDCIKNNYCREKGVRLLRIPYMEFESIDKILDKVLAG